jgi:hypothetical protein
MPGLVNYSAQNTATTTLTTTAETVVATLSGITTPGTSGRVSLTGTFQLEVGTAGASLVMRIRRGTTTSGTLVGASDTVTVTAGQTQDFAHAATDFPGEVAGASYVLTAAVGSATGNSTVKFATLTADVSPQ